MRCELCFLQSYHEAYLRGRPDLTYLVRRLRNEGKRIPDSTTEPNFYQMAVLPSHRPPHSDRITPAATGAEHAMVSASSSSNMGGHEASDWQFQQSAFASSSQKYPDAATPSQELNEPFYHSTPSAMCSFPTSSGIGITSSHASDRNEHSFDNRYRFSDRHQSPVQLTARGNLNTGSSDYTPKTAPEFSSTSVGTKERCPPEQGTSEMLHSAGENCYHEYNVSKQSASEIHPKTCNGMNVSSAVTMCCSSYSSGYITPYASTHYSSSGQNDNESNRGVAASTHHQSHMISAQTSTAIQTVTMGQQSLALLSSPPDDPVLEEFAREYLPHFGKTDDNHR